MLGKLIKNEFKATGRNFVPIYIIMLIVTVFMKIMIEVGNQTILTNRLVTILSILSVSMFVIAIIGLIFGTFILIIKRFYDNMLKDEGYLTFTLPVTTGQHIASKAIVSYAWILATVIIIILSMGILFLGENGVFKEFWETLTEGIKIISDKGWWLPVIEFIAIIVIGIYSKILQAYTCFSVGQNFNKHRIAGAFITYIAIYVIDQIINSAFLVWISGSAFKEEMSMVSGFFQPYMIYLLVFTIVKAVVFTVITHFMLNKRLNLE